MSKTVAELQREASKLNGLIIRTEREAWVRGLRKKSFTDEEIARVRKMSKNALYKSLKSN